MKTDEPPDATPKPRLLRRAVITRGMRPEKRPDPMQQAKRLGQHLEALRRYPVLSEIGAVRYCAGRSYTAPEVEAAIERAIDEHLQQLGGDYRPKR